MADELFPFKYWDPLRKRWVQARYKATKADMAARYEMWEITGPAWTPTDVDGRDKPPSG